ncbi:hypothetical protein NL676_029764 [Syzygium grande]|nr:hypothetical protein NL676_029764 [Syzygium grande]
MDDFDGAIRTVLEQIKASSPRPKQKITNQAKKRVIDRGHQKGSSSRTKPQQAVDQGDSSKPDLDTSTDEEVNEMSPEYPLLKSSLGHVSKRKLKENRERAVVTSSPEGYIILTDELPSQDSNIKAKLILEQDTKLLILGAIDSDNLAPEASDITNKVVKAIWLEFLDLSSCGFSMIAHNPSVFSSLEDLLNEL